ncbi:IPExxxVDY family protein [Aequorivita sp. SDUM287046]|uniref:IPExxxVDY family protein n=1 Tax=Aequorivita aurantiaca TaxID=3053356 RepID=A0ABT8DCW7_9FLAO|nr:IPExxxVDY family protein [Aequorivita aurantiaca]MDN3722996.1 IPExxxVDY family protein [Aequorivita aurantiaca]
MIHHKLEMAEDFEEPFTLIAIHCGEEEYKLAYLLNQHLNTRFKRRRLDIDFPSQGMMVTFPIYDFVDEFNYSQYHLVANKCRIAQAALQSSGGLFSEIGSEKDHFLLPEYKKVDYFLKIYSDFETRTLQSLVSQINKIEQIVSAYSLETINIKSKNNLIFD